MSDSLRDILFLAINFNYQALKRTIVKTYLINILNNINN